MKFNIKKFKNNITFFLISIILIIILLLLSIIGKEKTLPTEDLTDKESTVKNLIINEIMSSNKGTLVDENGNLYDYVELYNGEDKDINLKGYGLSDAGNEVKFTFPDITIKSKGYIIVYLSGTREDMHAPFKLKSSGGETLALFKPNGKVIDAVTTVSLKGDTVMARNSEGQWVIQETPTPGYPNTISGHEEFITSLKQEGDKTLVINEILPNNKGIFKTKLYNEYSGYIEIKNISEETINLENYSLSNESTVIYKWQFPNITIKPNEVILIFTSNRDNKTDLSELHTTFKLKNTNGEVILSDKSGHIIDLYKYEKLPSGMAVIYENNNYLVGNSISPGYSNTVDGIKKFQKEYMEVPEDLIINEVMNSNYEYLAQNGGEYYDWIELYNNTNKTIKLNDYCLTTNIDSTCKYKLPEVELKSKDYYIIMASGDENLSNDDYKHANFKISDTESIYLTKNNKIVDSLFIANIPKGYSYGRSGSYGAYYFSKPTPKNKNSN